MSRYIDADALKEKFINADANGINLTIDRYALKCIEDAPHIDIVRCKECRFGQWHEQAEEYICIAHGQDLFDGDHFCSYGDKKGADDE